MAFFKYIRDTHSRTAKYKAALESVHNMRDLLGKQGNWFMSLATTKLNKWKSSKRLSPQEYSSLVDTELDVLYDQYLKAILLAR